MATSVYTDHCAVRHGDHWTVTWLPGRKLDQNQAMSAMMLAEEVGCGLEPGDRITPTVASWAAELGLRPDVAVRAAFETSTARGGGR
jgi:hypothetical protein